jgi:hypothetical protein
MLVAGVNTAHYVSYDGKDIVVVLVKADKLFQERILSECKRFWECVENDVSPMEKINDTLEILATRLKELLLLDKQTTEEIKSIRDRISEIVEEDKAVFYGLSFSRSYRNGSIDYSKIPEISNVDLEQYRKPGSTVITIKRADEANG